MRQRITPLQHAGRGQHGDRQELTVSAVLEPLRAGNERRELARIRTDGSQFGGRLAIDGVQYQGGSIALER
jgi:hypothetical protein